MFANLKYFFLGSLVLIILAALSFTMLYKNSVQEILRDQSIQSNEAILTGFENTIYKENAQYIQFFEGNDPETNKTFTIEGRKAYKEFGGIFKQISDYFQDMPVIAAGFYTTSQELRYYYPYKEGIERTKTKLIREKRIIGLAEPINFKSTQSGVIENAEYITSSGATQRGSVIHSVKPVFDKDGNPIGAIEVFVSMSDFSNALNNLQYIGGIFIISVFAVLLASLYWIVRRAEKIISKQYDVNMELQSAKVAAESENEQKSQFLANISHELRTPLNAIIGFSEIMKDEILGEVGNQQYKNYVTDIHLQGVHLLSLINDILDFSKAEAGKLELEYEELDLKKLIKASMRTQEPRSAETQVELLSDLPNEAIILESDAKRLKQVLLNLLSNAVKFTPPNGRVIVSAWESAVDKKVFIEVLDTGIGIAAKDISKALAPFGQVDSELSRRYEGTGLGLPLTKKFIELLGGTMVLESEVGKGTKITFSLPKTNFEPPNAKGEKIESTSDNFESFQKPKMYVADDANNQPKPQMELTKEEPQHAAPAEPTPQPNEFEEPAAHPAAFEEPVPQPSAFEEYAPQPTAVDDYQPHPASLPDDTPHPAALEEPEPHLSSFDEHAPHPASFSEDEPHPAAAADPTIDPKNKPE